MKPKLSSFASQIVADRVFSRGEHGRSYVSRLANSPRDVKAAQALRFLVFNIELNEGLEKSYETCLDADPFDEICDHLLVEDARTGEIVGTYRLQTGAKAAQNLGFYSAQEFDMAPYEPFRGELIELGRACVHCQHRNLAVLALLWKGIAAYARERGGRFLVGCSSLTSQDPKVGAAMYQLLARKHLVQPELRTSPLPALACPLDQSADKAPKIPKLLSAYLSVGAFICGPPAIDREFKTIDFLTLLDLPSLPERTVERYLS
jgi:putative hemolysin